MAQAKVVSIAPFLAKGFEETDNVCRFTLRNGLVVELNPSRLSEEIRDQAMKHGLLQKIGDAAAGFSKEENYSGAFSAMQGVVDNLMGGLWNAKGQGGSGDLAEAIKRLKKVSIEDAQAAVRGMDEEQLKGVLANATVKAMLAKIKSERAAAVAKLSEDELVIPGL